MHNDNIISLNTPAQDVLFELLNTRTQLLSTQAIEAEVTTLLAHYRGSNIAVNGGFGRFGKCNTFVHCYQRFSLQNA
tara:strand:- start:513 stop:743 length:231 start_codon:yes stop_codon:yes gene_type:complete